MFHWHRSTIDIIGQLQRFDRDLKRKAVRIIPFDGLPLGERRETRFLIAFGLPAETTRIVAFGKCNMKCPYCHRDAQFVDEEYNVAGAVEMPLVQVLWMIDEALRAGETIRLSGGDPSMYPQASIAIAEFVRLRGGRLSYCHNGSAPGYVRRMNPYVAHAAIDIKGIRPADFALRAGLGLDHAAKYLENAVRCIDILVDGGVTVDVRTTVFADSSLEDLHRIGELLNRRLGEGRLFWTLRNYDPVVGVNWRQIDAQQLDDWMVELSVAYPSLPMGCRSSWFDGRLVCFRGGNRDRL